MIVYWSACLASVIAAGVCMHRSLLQQRRWIAVFLSAMPMILVAALRYDVGEDYLRTYMPYFEAVQQMDIVGYVQMEPLYHLLNAVASRLYGGYFWVFAITAVSFYALLYDQIFEDSPYPLLSIFLVTGMCYCFVFFNAMRQMVGCAVLLYSVRYIQQRRLLPFLLCVLIAAGFHKSCVLFAVMYWIARIKIRPIMSFGIIAAVAVGSQAVSLLLRWIISKTQYAIYLMSVFDTGQTAYVMLAIHVVLLIFMSVCYCDNEQYRLYYNMQIASCIITLLSGKVVLILRMLWMFGLPAVISLPMAVSSMPGKNRDKKLVMSIIVLLYFAYATYTVGVQNSNHVLPYQTIFSRWIS